MATCRTRAQVAGSKPATELLNCVAQGNLARAQEMVASGVSPSARSWCDGANPHGKGAMGPSPLWYAAVRGETSMLTLFLESCEPKRVAPDGVAYTQGEYVAYLAERTSGMPRRLRGIRLRITSKAARPS